MNNFDLISMSFRNLMRRKTRMILTILGVVIGTASIVVMMSLGLAMDKNFKTELSRMGSLNIIQIYPGAPQPNMQSLKLDDDAVTTFERISGVQAVMAEKNVFIKVVAGKMIAGMSVIGIDPDKMKYFGFKPEEGRLLLASDKNAMIIGKQVAFNFYNPRSRGNGGGMMDMTIGGPGPMAEPEPPIKLYNRKLQISTDSDFGEPHPGNTDPSYIHPKPHDAKVVGILKQSNDEKDYNAYMNLKVLESIVLDDQRVSGQRPVRNSQESKYGTIRVKVADINQVAAVQKEIIAMGYQASSLTDMLESMRKQSRTVMAILGAIGAVSLLVAAIGIANTMMMSIYERTREIGIIKVLGADISDIKKLFLLEAAMIGFGGGMIGLGLSYLISYGLNKGSASFAGQVLAGEVGQISVILPELALGAVLFATLIGIVSGYLPARRAMNLSALEAMRNE